ncbi:hypothetical protein IGI04_014656 [Brassica rapa subsp. trilocularis]|nr:hypothetical protein IGI04_014656 [Brassica rapa subsp. trilocularis]
MGDYSEDENSYDPIQGSDLDETDQAFNEGDECHGEEIERDDPEADQEDSWQEEADSEISLEVTNEHDEDFSKTEDVDGGEACSQSGETENEEESYAEERAWCDYSDQEDDPQEMKELLYEEYVKGAGDEIWNQIRVYTNPEPRRLILATRPNRKVKKAPPKEPSLLKHLSREDGTTTSSILLQEEPPDQSPNRQAVPLDAPIKLPNQLLEVDFSPTMKRPSPEPIMGQDECLRFPEVPKSEELSYLWNPGDHINHPKDIPYVLRCTSTQRIRRILIYFNLPYLESQSLKLQQLFFLHSMHDISTFQTIKKIPRKLTYPLKPPRYKEDTIYIHLAKILIIKPPTASFHGAINSFASKLLESPKVEPI